MLSLIGSFPDVFGSRESSSTNRPLNIVLGSLVAALQWG